MKCTFVGVGSAFDENLTNTSLLLEADGHSILMDCGFNAGHAYARLAVNPHDLDVLWISHFHGDHFGGVPFLLGYLFSAERRRLLIICGSPGVEDKVCSLVRLAYPNLLEKLLFDIVFQEVSPGDRIELAGFRLTTAEMDHSEKAQAVRVEHGGCALFYSGDGRLTEACRDLVSGVDLAVLESYKIDEDVKGHSSILKCIDFISSVKIGQVALVHLDPFVRTLKKNAVTDILEQVDFNNIFLPDDGQTVLIGRS